MAAKTRTAKHQELSGLAKSILQDVRDDFTAKELPARTLNEQYEGVSIPKLQQKYCGAGGATQVDFDLALKELEDGLLARTGPMVPYENVPGSGIFILSLYSKREYTYLTEAGYRVAAQIGNPKPRNAPSYVHISGGTFHQSQIGIGEQVTQMQNVDIDSDPEVIERLTKLLVVAESSIDTASRAEIARLVALAREGDAKEAKSIFQKLFGFASETVKQAAWGILTAIITKAIGM